MNVSKSIRSALALTLCAALMSFPSCGNENSAMDIGIFEKSEPIEVVSRPLSGIDYKSIYESRENYELCYYQESAKFSELYPGAELTRKEFDCQDENIVSCSLYKHWLYLNLVGEDNVSRVIRYDLKNAAEELIFTYEGENQMLLAGIDDKYIIWKEGENANWLKVSLNCYDVKKGENKKFFTYARDKDGYMNINAYVYNRILFDGDHVYFSEYDGYSGWGNAHTNLYDYDIAKDELTLITEEVWAQPIVYKGLSWVGYDSDTNEYILKNQKDSETMPLGRLVINLCASKKILAKLSYCDDDRVGIMYFDGNRTYPIIQSSYTISSVSCTDRFITWRGSKNDGTLYFDIGKKRIVDVDCLETGRDYSIMVNDEYLVLLSYDYIPDPEAGNGAAKVKSMIYYFIRISELR